MSTMEQLIDASPIRQAESSHLGRQNEWFTPGTYAAVIASGLVLPALAAVIEAFVLRSPGLFLVGLLFLIGFGASYYILLHSFLEADIASDAETEQYLATIPLEQTLAVSPQMTLSPREDRGPTTSRTSQKHVRHFSRQSA